MASPRVQIRPLTIVLVVVAALLVAIGVAYFTTSAADLPALMPGHQANSTHHHVKHGIAMIGLAVVALIAAWFTTAPKREAPH
jgi:hypothetical protein